MLPELQESQCKVPAFFPLIISKLKKVLLLIPDNAENSMCFYHSEHRLLEVKNILTFKKRSAANRISLIAEQQQEPQLEFQQKRVLTTEKKEKRKKDISGSSFFF